jgi:hypothetical protein
MLPHFLDYRFTDGCEYIRVLMQENYINEESTARLGTTKT